MGVLNRPLALRPSPTLNRYVEFLNTVSGLDKVLALIQYFSIVLKWASVRAGRTSLAERINNLGVPEQSLLTRRRRDIRLDDDVEVVQKQKRQLKAEGDRIFQDTLINMGYLPLTLHWSVENSSFPEIGVGVFGTLASAFELSKAWKAI
ncbi:16932_t:CDS:2 [Cetraspora pellucida]|uniref:16932_t:CDS:1 n=1 Tax=Cetraspora pellucida TaxID=1433469 RepID=A0A9N9AVQ1_9GLOM|nr:16932_t:CDS:2 [Cetraspora pellucida]